MSLRTMDERIDKTFTAIANESRTDFTYNIFHNPKGIWFQNIMKPVLRKTVDYVWRQLKGKYDTEAYIFDDVRLQAIRKRIDEYTQRKFRTSDCGCRKNSKPLMQLVDIMLFLAKEDIHMRSLLFDFMNEQGFEFELTDLEKKNLERWT